MSPREFTIEDQNADVSEADIAGLRWRAIEAANSMEGVSPTARRVFVAMICAMDNRTRECYPSEVWLAAFMGVHLMSVKKAKAELREKHYLITWVNPKGPRHQSFYQFNWQKIERLSEEAKNRARDAVEERRAGRVTSGSRTTTLEAPSQGSHTATIETETRVSKVVKSLLQGSQIASQGSHTAMPKVAVRLPEQPFNSPSRTTQPNTPSAGAAAPDGRAPSAGGDDQIGIPRPAVTKGALEEGRVPALQSYPYPQVLAAFEEADPVRAALLRLDADGARTMSRLLATKGKAAAAEFAMREVS